MSIGLDFRFFNFFKASISEVSAEPILQTGVEIQDEEAKDR